jgi:hypothetical protein
MDLRNKHSKQRKGQILLLGMMIAIFVFIFAIIAAPVLKDMIDYGRTGMDCSNTSITTGQKMTCIAIDLILPYFIGSVIFGAVAYLFIKNTQQV